MINEISISGASAFTQTNDCGTIIPGQNCTIMVSFQPTMTPKVTGSIIIFSDASTAILSAPLGGSGE